MPVHAVRQVVVFGNVQVTTHALQTLVENEVPVAYLTGHGKFVGALVPAGAKNFGLREAQYRRFTAPAECLALARLANQRTQRMRSLRGDDARGSDEPAARGLYNLLRGATTRRPPRACWAPRGRGRRCTSARSRDS